MKRLKVVWLGVAFALLPAIAQAQFINFDDVTTRDGIVCPEPPLPNGYHGFDWYNFYVLNGSDHFCKPAGGYRNGVVSSPNVAFNGFGGPASVSRTIPFTFNSVFMTAANNNGLTVLVEGYLGLSRRYHQSFVLDSYIWTPFVFNWTGVDAVWFTSSGGTDAGYVGSGTHVAFDNMTMSPDVIPEPATLLLLGTGLVGVGAAARRRRRKRIES